MKYEGKWLSRCLEINDFGCLAEVPENVNWRSKLYFLNEILVMKAIFPAAAPLGPRGVGPRYALFFYLLRCKLWACCVKWSRSSWYAMLFAAFCNDFTNIDCSLKHLCTNSLFGWGFLCVLITRCLCMLCIETVLLPKLVDAGGECFAPHLTFPFWNGECHKCSRKEIDLYRLRKSWHVFFVDASEMKRSRKKHQFAKLNREREVRQAER